MINRLIGRLRFQRKGVQNVYHKNFKNKVEPALRFAGIQYYRFKDDLDMPFGRYQYLTTFINSVEMRITHETLNKFLEALEKALNGSKGKIDVGEAILLVAQLRTRTKIVVDLEIAYQLASCVFFTEEEPLNTYDMALNKKKIERWKEANALEVFMVMPVRELLGLKNTSTTALANYLKEVAPIAVEMDSLLGKAIANDSMMI